MKTLLIDTNRVKANVARIRERAGNSLIYGVLKGNAYGLGLLEMAEILRNEGITRFALTDVEDAVKLRENGFQNEEILMLRSTTETDFIEKIVEYNLIGTIGSQDAALALNGIADKQKTVVEAHIKIDTGMGRYGFVPGEIDKIISFYKHLSNVALTGIYTHFYSAWNSEKITRLQAAQFEGVIEKLRGKGIEPGLVHAANSSALFRFDFCHYDAVRIGSAFTGRMPTKFNYGLQRVGVITCPIAEIRWLPKGSTIGYGGVYKTRQARRIAVIPVGYADGFCVEKSHDSYRVKDAIRYMLSEFKRGLLRKKLYVTVNSAQARVIGHVGMLHTVIDVTDIDCAPGDLAQFEINPILTGIIKRTYK
ncbi:MAG: alanine racemase [Eubacteriales bacterium]|jgi:alanine racemase